MPDHFITVAAVSTAVISATALLTWLEYRRRRKKAWHKVGKVSQMFIHPVKSFRGILVNEAQVTPLGLVNENNRDRMLALLKDGLSYTAREEPRLVLLEPSVVPQGTRMIINARRIDPEAPDLVVDLTDLSGERVDIDVFGNTGKALVMGGVAASEWFKGLLGADVKLVMICPESDQDSHRMVQLESAPWFNYDDQVSSNLADLVSFLLINFQSYKYIEAATPSKIYMNMRRYRPNIVVDGDIPKFAEEDWRKIRINDVEFENVKLCERCQLTTVHPETGKKEPSAEPLITLNKLRRRPSNSKYSTAPNLGINLVTSDNGTIRTGDEVFVQY